MEVKVRGARASDKQPLMKFVSKTWGGHDYVPDIWDDWMRDKKGKIFVAVAGGKQVGMNRIRFLPERIGWLEGARIHPRFRRKGLASLLGKNSMEFGGARGMHTFRLTSSTKNKSARKQVAKMGFREKVRFDVYEVKRAAFRGKTPARRVRLSNLDATWKFFRSAPEFRSGGGLCWDAFVARTLNKENLATLIGNGRVFVSRNDRGSQAAAILGEVAEGSEAWTQLGFLCGETKQCTKLIRYIFRTGAIKQVGENLVFIPQKSQLSRVVKEMSSGHHFQMVVYERKVR